jgi:protein involved in polysaccharide export with SLBB domain
MIKKSTFSTPGLFALLCTILVCTCVKRVLQDPQVSPSGSSSTSITTSARQETGRGETISKNQYLKIASQELAQHQIEIPPPPMRTQIIYPGDHLEVSIYEKLPVSQEKRVEVKRVNEKGTILVIPIGEVAVAGFSLTEAQQTIERKLTEFIISPFCEISIVKREYEPSVYVFGEANRNGVVPIKRGDRILDVISQVGGCKFDAYRRSIKLIRLVDSTVTLYSIDLAGLLERGTMEQNMLMRDQDIVYVPRRFLTTYQEVMQGLSGIMPWYFFIKGL